ncbi:LytR/AlgR family response regulator transcription factor [Paramaledivibacter caminithermalis]|uniref:Stage 0 sporulation protein A homolog n=1 Tax=Paramaledivibacter caminithermalis (strain DSM 15212 / CIP 107654 / DViRD3) TaxID=1121301 RepID=A0A1M6SDD7_PARC5|nr:LytTR family DNA-binding domain-containing protein [Paramaledivibacter caminithermalis]SHK42557.1 two component transcriptional regulator, LytTR family [Paramaledivibacter caminithermalis DSM 15212]
MINFIICEDDNRFRKNIRSFINNYIDMKKFEARIAVETILYKEVLEYVNENATSKNIYILDIELNDTMNGLQLAKKIREHDIYGYIVFVTNHIQLSLMTYKYKIKALDFIVKQDGDIDKRLHEALDVAVNEIKKCEACCEDNKVFIKSGSSMFCISLNNIICIETSSSVYKLIVHTDNKRIEFYSTIKKIREKLDNNFYQIHRSCIINMRHIKEINREKYGMYVLMDNGEKYPLSKKYMRELIEHVKYCS